MLNDRERDELRQIESGLSESDGLERRMRVHAWRSTPHKAIPWLPVILLIVGVLGILAAAYTTATVAGRVLLAIGSVTLIGYALCQFPVNPSPGLRPDEESGQDAD
jgi:hypothetical protein